ncbi:MAG: TlpA disulfide reductase family protein [Bacteroidota bacterium]
MKKRFFTMILGLSLMSGWTIAQTFTINAKIDGVKAGKAELQTVENNKMVTKYSTGIAEDGSFTIKGKLAVPDIYVVKINDLKGRIALFLDNSIVTITGKSENLMASTITGSITHNDYAKFSQLAKSQNELKRPLYASLNEAEKANKTVEVKKIEAQMDDLEASQIKEKIDFIKTLGDSPVAAYIAYNIALGIDDTEKLETLVQDLGPTLADNKYTKMLVEKIGLMKLTTVGKMSMDFTQNDPDGKPVRLSDFKGKYVLVDFWASWCSPCRAENPNVVKVFQKYNNKNFTILGVSLDRDKDKWLEAIQKDNLTWTHVSDLKFWDNEVAVMYGIKSIPANILLDKTGKIIGKNLRGDDLEAALAKALK